MAFDPVVELAENADTYTPLVRGNDRVLTDRYVIWFGEGIEPPWTVAQRFRFRSDELDEVMDEIHEHVRAHGRTACSWEVGSSATPTDLVDLLHERGIFDDPRDPLAIGMALTGEPAGPSPEGIEVRRVASDDDELNGQRGDRRDRVRRARGRRQGVRSRLADRVLPRVHRRRAGRTGDRVVLRARRDALRRRDASAFRGRGVYKALVHARRDAAAQGVPVAVTQAGSMSKPILEKLGFREVCRIRALIDEFDN